MEKQHEAAAAGVVAEVAAGIYLARGHLMVIKAGEALGKTDVVDILAGIEQGRVGIYPRRDVPSAASEPRRHFIFKCEIVVKEKVERRCDREKKRHGSSEQQYFEISLHQFRRTRRAFLICADLAWRSAGGRDRMQNRNLPTSNRQQSSAVPAGFKRFSERIGIHGCMGGSRN